jgi:hypothetical protein
MYTNISSYTYISTQDQRGSMDRGSHTSYVYMYTNISGNPSILYSFIYIIIHILLHQLRIRGGLWIGGPIPHMYMHMYL